MAPRLKIYHLLVGLPVPCTALSLSVCLFVSLSLCVSFSIYLSLFISPLSLYFASLSLSISLFLFISLSLYFSLFLSFSLYLSLFDQVSTDKKLLAAEGAAHFWLDNDFYYIDVFRNPSLRGLGLDQQNVERREQREHLGPLHRSFFFKLYEIGMQRRISYECAGLNNIDLLV